MSYNWEMMQSRPGEGLSELSCWVSREQREEEHWDQLLGCLDLFSPLDYDFWVICTKYLCVVVFLIYLLLWIHILYLHAFTHMDKQWICMCNCMWLSSRPFLNYVQTYVLASTKLGSQDTQFLILVA